MSDRAEAAQPARKLSTGGTCQQGTNSVEESVDVGTAPGGVLARHCGVTRRRRGRCRISRLLMSDGALVVADSVVRGGNVARNSEAAFSGETDLLIDVRLRDCRSGGRGVDAKGLKPLEQGVRLRGNGCCCWVREMLFRA